MKRLAQISLLIGLLHVAAACWAQCVDHPTYLRRVGSFALPGRSRGIALVDHYLYVGNERAPLQVLDVAEPLSPRLVATVDLYRPVALAAAGSYVYVASGQDLVILDVADPTHPQVVNSVLLSNVPFSVAVAGEYAYVPVVEAGVDVVWIGSPQYSRIAARMDAGDRGIAIVDTLAYTGGGGQFFVLDVTLRGLARPPVGILPLVHGVVEQVAVVGHLAYVAAGYDGLLIIDVADPTRPRLVTSWYPPQRFVRSLVVRDNLLLVTDFVSSTLLDVSAPAAPRVLSDVCGGGDAVVRAGSHAYVTQGNAGISILEIIDPVPVQPQAWTDLKQRYR